ncbi:hypothetical protein AB1K54_09380 [Microbacterium sp. BWT-B31]|uniref:hypothetical protein n=1 Tax=Microbacterium sp. BWT-B31 TaxID=3232072 RepID=UPI003527A0D2
MSLDLAAPPNSRALAAAHDLGIVVDELQAFADRLVEVTAVARGLAAQTDWRAKAAAVFHTRAERWAGEVSGLACAAETARLDAVEAQRRMEWIAWQGWEG